MRRASRYVLPDAVTPAAVRVSLESHFDLDADPAEVVERAYFDTFDGLAREAGVLLLWESGRLLLVNRDDRELAVLGLPRRPATIRATDLPAGTMHELLTARFPARKTPEDFDFAFQTSLKRDTVLHLGQLDRARC